MARTFELTTPLGADVLLFHRLSAREELSRLSDFRLDALSTRGDINVDDILGKNVTIKVELAGDKLRYFNGYVTRFAQVGMRGRYHAYQATVRPWLWFLTRRANCRIFQQMTVPDILKKVFNDHPGLADTKFQLTASYRTWDYCVQYRETDFNFVSRLMEQEGIYYFFKYSEGHNTLVVADSYSAHSTLPGCEQLPYIPQERMTRPEQERITSWSFERKIQPGRYVLDDYDPEKPNVELQVKTQFKRGHSFADYEIYDYPGEYLKTDEGEQYVRTRMEELHAQFELAQGQTNARGLSTGYLVKLTGQPRADQNREYLVVSAQHQLAYSEYESMEEQGTSYECTFTMLNSKQPYRPARVTPKPFVQGPQTAVVVGPAGNEIYTDKYGRVKVQFHWDRYGKSDENSSCWIRVSHPTAGKGWGSIALPRIGHEVIVDFLEGDPDRPIISGRVYNGENMPPSGLPETGMVSGMKSNSTPGGGGYNQITMDDTKGKEKMTLHGQYDMDTTVQHDQKNTVNNKFTETIKSDAAISITEGKYSHDVVAGTAAYHVQGALTERYDATQSTTVKQDITIVSTGGPIAVSSDSQHVYINAATSIQLHVGQSSIWMDSGGQINIKGVNVVINGSTAVTTKGGIVHSEADSEHQTKGAIVLSEGSATNTVKGGMVMLNP